MAQGCNVLMKDAFLKRYILEGKKLFFLRIMHHPSTWLTGNKLVQPQSSLHLSMPIFPARTYSRVSKKVMLLCDSRPNPNIQPSHSKLTACFSGPHSSEQYLLQISQCLTSNQEHYSPSRPIFSHLPQSLQNPAIQTFSVHLQEMSLVRLDQHICLHLTLSSIVAIHNNDIYDLRLVRNVECIEA
jgi:hypothetical protein